ESDVIQFAVFGNPPVSLFPGGELRVFGCPVNNRSFITPLVDHPRDSRMNFAITECEHRLQVLPRGDCPVRTISVDQQLSLLKSRCFSKRSLDLPGIPVESRQKSNRSNTQPGDGNDRHLMPPASFL